MKFTNASIMPPLGIYSPASPVWNKTLEPSSGNTRGGAVARSDNGQWFKERIYDLEYGGIISNTIFVIGLAVAGSPMPSLQTLAYCGGSCAASGWRQRVSKMLQDKGSLLTDPHIISASKLARVLPEEVALSWQICLRRLIQRAVNTLQMADSGSMWGSPQWRGRKMADKSLRGPAPHAGRDDKSTPFWDIIECLSPVSQAIGSITSKDIERGWSRALVICTPRSPGAITWMRKSRMAKLGANSGGEERRRRCLDVGHSARVCCTAGHQQAGAQGLQGDHIVSLQLRRRMSTSGLMGQRSSMAWSQYEKIGGTLRRGKWCGSCGCNLRTLETAVRTGTLRAFEETGPPRCSPTDRCGDNTALEHSDSTQSEEAGPVSAASLERFLQ